jgi:spectinomycin phosphotransferase
VKDLPTGFDVGELAPALSQGWDIAADSLEYVAVGFGSYHWIATIEGRQRFFVTVDDLDQKSWLGDTCESVFAGLQHAFDAAAALRNRGGLEFVVAPLPTSGGETVRRVGRRHSVAVFPFLAGQPGQFGGDTTAAYRMELVGLLAELHQATPHVPQDLASRQLDFAGRRGLEAALHDLDRPWHGGPFAEPARGLLSSHAGELLRRVDDFDQLVGAVSAMNTTPVVTHGEPHPGNVMRSDGRLVLIDWDTVGLALPERDLWSVAAVSSPEMAMYVDATGYEVSGPALSLYGQAWDLTDIAEYVHLFRSPHQDTDDTQDAWANLEETVRAETSREW